MKKTQLKDALRNIWKQKVSYLSIIVIAFLGVTTFLGINYSDGALRRNGSIMYNAVNYRDIEIVSTALLTGMDLDALLDVEGVEDVEAVWQTGAKATSQEKRQDINVITLTRRINQPELIEGRMPEKDGECAVEARLAQDMGWQLGDRVEALNAKGEKADNLKDGKFEIVGIANHPDHTSISIPDTLYVMVPRTAFDVEDLDDCFMKAEIVVEKPEGIDRFSPEYNAVVGKVFAELEALGEARAPLRNEEVKEETQTRLDDAQNELDEAQDQLEKAREDLDEGWNALNDGERQIDEKEDELANAVAQLEELWDKLQNADIQLAEGKAQLDALGKKLRKGERELKEGREQLDQGREALVSAWNQLEDAKEQVRSLIRSKLGSAASSVNWAGRIGVDLDNPVSSARELWITDSIRVDLSTSPETIIRELVYSGQIPDEALIELYESMMGGEG